MGLTRVAVEAGVATLTLDDPDRRNAMTLAMVEEIVAHLDRLEQDGGVGALVITGAPPAFCAGADLGQLGGAPAGGATAASGGMASIYEGFLRVARSSLPTLAAVNGAAVGAGMNLAMACDVRLAGRSARFDTRFVQLGLHPGGGHTWMLARLAGPQTAAALVLFGEVLDGPAAERVGLAWRCVEDDALAAAAQALAAKAASNPPELARRVKQTLSAVQAMTSHDEAVALELDAQLWSIAQPAFAERLAALRSRISRRAP